MSKFSDTPQGRRVIVVIDDNDYSKLLHHDEDELLRNTQVSVIRHSDFLSGEISHPIIEKLDQRGLIAPGKVLIQDPFSPDIYHEQATALTSISLQKHFHLSVVCKILGAKSLKVTQVDVASEQIHRRADALVNSPMVDVDLSYQEKLKQKLSKEMKLCEIWSGGEPDIESASRYLDKHGLDSDIPIKSLVDMMHHQGNKLLTREFSFYASSEANKNLEICAKIGINKINSIKGSFVEESTKLQDIQLRVAIEF